jgi:formylmethanofuran dehydrogenase subunit B
MHVVEDFACTLCSCVCDDLKLTIDGERIVRTERACKLSEPWLLSQNSQSPPAAQIGGRTASFEAAVERAAGLLAESRYPLIYGLSRSSTDGQRAAVRLADAIGATIDTTASRGHAPSVMAVQQVGESTCSLGEIKNRSDLVIFWGCNPAETHPRHFERYAVDCAGLFTPRGRRDRTIVVIDVKPTATSELADFLITVEPGRDLEAIWALRGLLQGVQPREDAVTGMSLDVLEDLVERMKSCRSGAIFFGFGLARQPAGHLAVEALMRLVTELNEFTRFYVRRLRGSGDVTGADAVLAWQTGYPFSVNLARGFPRYNPGEFSANNMLERGEPDVCLFVGSMGATRFTDEASKSLRRIPSIVLDPPTGPAVVAAAVQFTTSVYGIHAGGTAYRMDDIPIPLRAVLPSKYPTDAEVLAAIERQIPDLASGGVSPLCHDVL